MVAKGPMWDPGILTFAQLTVEIDTTMVRWLRLVFSMFFLRAPGGFAQNFSHPPIFSGST